MSEPPQNAIEAAVRAARLSPCAKSKRGAVVFYPYTDGRRRTIIASGFNGPPGGIECTGTQTCHNLCNRACVHAEARAIRAAAFRAESSSEPDLSGLDILHVKIVEGELVAGGHPSCWQCSREVLDSGLDGFWLFEIDESAPASAAPHGCWRRYSAAEFHEVTWENVHATEEAAPP